MKNIHVLPTDKSSSLYREDDGTFGYDFVLKSYGGIDHYHMYITSDEEIKKGDWCLYNKNHNSINPNWELVKCGVIEREEMHPISNGRLLLWMTKIILATDLDLIIDGVQSIPDEFLEWFVKNPSCEEVEIEKMFNVVRFTSREFIYKIIIPKEEPKQDYSDVHLSHCYQGEYKDGCKYDENDCPAKPLNKPKQETLEEASEKYCDIPEKLKGQKYKWSAQDRVLYNAFIDGAKWQAERMYSEEKMHKLMDDYQDYLFKTNEPVKTFKEWFEQFKKK